jgi:hypothetical protein
MLVQVLVRLWAPALAVPPPVLSVLVRVRVWVWVLALARLWALKLARVLVPGPVRLWALALPLVPVPVREPGLRLERTPTAQQAQRREPRPGVR